jgi:hypothetical protein
MQKYTQYLRVLFAGLVWCSLFWSGWFGSDLFWESSAQAGALTDRIATFPNWQTKPPVQVAEGDLFYPEWFQGEWLVSSTLVDLVAPLAPEIVSPGFESNRQYLNQPMQFRVRFVTAPAISKPAPFPFARSIVPSPSGIVSDRAFNGLSLARAYLGNGDDSPVIHVKVDPESPNRQITLLKGNRQLLSIVTGRATETPAPNQFITTEVFQQVFRGQAQPYLNQVETTTAYQQLTDSDLAFQADQITAVYLSPKDPNYFKTGRPTEGFRSNLPLEAIQERPVALYRYHLAFSKPDNP